MSNKLNLFTPHNKQAEVIQAINNPMIKFVTVVAGRQSGKSELGINTTIEYCVQNSNKIVWWVSPTASQAKEVFDKMLNYFGHIPKLFISTKASRGDTEIVFFNGSKIRFKAAAQGEALRGGTLDRIVIDEAAMMKAEFVEDILLAMISTKRKAKVIYLTTPKGKNWVYTNYLKGQNEAEPKYASFHFTTYDSPMADIEYVNLVKANINTKRFDQEWLAIFTDQGSQFNDVPSIATLSPISSPVAGVNLYMGVDIALQGGDYAVISILNDKGEQVYFDRINKTNGPFVTNWIKDAILKWKPKKAYCEINGLGKPIVDSLKIEHKINNIVEWVTTNKSKNEIINNLTNAMEKGEIKLINDEALITEFEAFEMTVNGNGTTRFGAPAGFTDDLVIATALANECLNKNRYAGGISFC